jgi:hypothetical protein
MAHSRAGAAGHGVGPQPLLRVLAPIQQGYDPDNSVDARHPKKPRLQGKDVVVLEEPPRHDQH